MLIIDYNFFGFEFGGCVWDTPICTDQLDELVVGEGVYDEIYVDLDTNIPDNTAKPTNWSMRTIMDAKFTGDLDAGSIGADGFKITNILLYRTLVGTGKWDAIAEFNYNDDYNVYNYVDRYAQNGAVYQYALVPVANELLGDKLISDPVQCEYEGIFLTDKNENRKLEYDINLGDITFNKDSGLITPINSQYPIAVFGNSNYRTGSLSVLPLSNKTIETYGNEIDKLQEQVNRKEWLDFINNNKAKVLRMDNGVLILIVTHNAKQTHKEGSLRDLASLSFDFTEIGDITFETLKSNDLIANADMQKSTFDDYGGVISG